MRLIDADALKRNFEANVPAFAQDMVPGICYIIDRARTIDAVPVIRCKECKHCAEGITFGIHWLRCEQNKDAMKEVYENDWCCWAERKEL